MQFQFKVESSFEQRRKQSFYLIEKYGQWVPIIAEIQMNNRKKEKGIPNLKQIKKMMVEGSMQISKLSNFFKEKYFPNMSEQDVLYIFYGGNKILSSQMSNTIIEFYQKYKDEDGFLYLQITTQDGFG